MVRAQQSLVAGHGVVLLSPALRGRGLRSPRLLDDLQVYLLVVVGGLGLETEVVGLVVDGFSEHVVGRVGADGDQKVVQGIAGVVYDGEFGSDFVERYGFAELVVVGDEDVSGCIGQGCVPRCVSR